MIAETENYYDEQKQLIHRWKNGERLTFLEQNAAIKASYEMAHPGRHIRRRHGITLRGAPSDYHYRTDVDLMMMIETALDIDRNDQIVSAAITRVIANVLQDGIHPQPNTGNERVDAVLAERWEEWTKNEQLCDSQREMCFQTMTELAFRTVLVCGDILAIPRRDQSIQLLEPHRLRNGTARPTGEGANEVIHGVEIDQQRRRVRYWVTEENVNPMQSVRYDKMVPLPAYDADGNRAAFHLRTPKRVSQTRGLSAFTPIANTISQLDDIVFAKLVQSQCTSSWAIIREKAETVRAVDDREPQDQQKLEPFIDNTGSRVLENLSPGMEIVGNVGERLSGFSPNVPNVTYFDHVKQTLSFISVNLDLPLILLLMDASQTNFSGWRGAMDQAKIRFRAWQRWLVQQWYRPVYQWKVRQFMASDPWLARRATQNSIAIYETNWEPPSWPYIEPLKDAAADILVTRNAQNSQRRVQAMRGRKWSQVVEELTDDNLLMIETCIQKATALRERYPDENIPWQFIMSLPTPDRMSASWSVQGTMMDGGPDTELSNDSGQDTDAV